MYIVSWNINGLKSRFDELKQLVNSYNPDFICLQKVRCNSGREQFEIEGFRALHAPVDSGKWSGVITYARIPDDVDYHSPSLAMPERILTPGLSNGGHLQVFRCKDFALVNAYVPFNNPAIADAEKYRKTWDEQFLTLVKQLSTETPVVICGDLNVVHTIKDTCENRLEQQRPCFFRWERDNFERLLKDADLVDAYREVFPDKVIPTFYGNYRNTGIGNRIDYFLISRSLIPCLVSSDILTGFGSGQSVPIILDFNPGVLALSGDCESTQSLTPKALIHNADDTECISVREAAQWIATMAASDGFVSPKERKLLKNFADTYGIEAKSIYNMAFAIANNIDVPEVKFVSRTEMVGRMFEDFVVSLCSDKSRFRLLAWRGDKINGDVYALENLLPDLHIRHRLDNRDVEYYVECKYRSSWGDGGIDLSDQYVRYHNAAKDRKIELFIALGVGGTPSNPDEFFLVPGRMVKLDKTIDRERFFKCLCSKDPDGFHAYINHYFNRRVFKNV